MSEKILVVDDEPDLREAMSEVLRSSGFTVSEAKNGTEAVEIALSEHPDLILLDIMMPGLSGHEALREIRADKWGKNAKVVYLTSLSDPEHIVSAVKQDSSQYIVKSNTSLPEIVTRVKQVLAGYDD